MLITVEEGAQGGFGSMVATYLANNDLIRPGFRLRTLTLPDLFQGQDDQFRQYEAAGLNAADIAGVIEESLIRTA